MEKNGSKISLKPNLTNFKIPNDIRTSNISYKILTENNELIKNHSLNIKISESIILENYFKSNDKTLKNEISKSILQLNTNIIKTKENLSKENTNPNISLNSIITNNIFINITSTKTLEFSKISKKFNNTNIKNDIDININNKSTNYKNQTNLAYSESINQNNDLFPLIIGIILPIILIIFILLLIFYCVKRKKELIIKNDNSNKLNFKNKRSYKKIHNTSNLNILNTNNISLGDIKSQNYKNEINNILSSSSGSSSSAKRKRGKKIDDNNNITTQEKHKEAQNEIKEQIKQFVIDENKN